MAWKNCVINCWHLSGSIAIRISKLDIQCSTNIVATAVPVVRAVTIALVKYKYRSVINTMNMFPAFFCGKGPRLCSCSHNIMVQSRKLAAFTLFVVISSVPCTPKTISDSCGDVIYHVCPIQFATYRDVNRTLSWMFGQQRVVAETENHGT